MIMGWIHEDSFVFLLRQLRDSLLAALPVPIITNFAAYWPIVFTGFVVKLVDPTF